MIKSTVILRFISKFQEIAINLVANRFIRNLGKLVRKFYNWLETDFWHHNAYSSATFLIPMLLVNPFLRHQVFSQILSFFLGQITSYNCIWLLLCPESYPGVVTKPPLFRQVAQHCRTGEEGRGWMRGVTSGGSSANIATG